MPSSSTHTSIWPGLAFWVGVTAALAVFGFFGTIALLLVKVGVPSLPDPMVSTAAVFTGTAAVVCAIIGMTRLLHKAGVTNTRAAVIAVLDARRDILEDTGEIKGLREILRQPEIIIVERATRHVDQVDRDRAMRVIREAERSGAPMAAARTASGDRDLYWRTYTDAVKDLAGIGEDEEGASSPQ